MVLYNMNCFVLFIMLWFEIPTKVRYMKKLSHLDFTKCFARFKDYDKISANIGATYQSEIRNSRKTEARKTITGKNVSSQFDLLINALTSQHWVEEEIACKHKVLDILENVKNSTLWATWIWDSMQSPTGIFYGSQYQFGNYDQCMKAPWLETHSAYKTKYCLADVHLSDEEPQDVILEPNSPVKSYINSISKHGITFNTITWGMCVPVQCSSQAIVKIARSLFQNTHLGLTIPVANIKVHSCQIPGSMAEYSMESYLVIYGIAFAVVVAILCTIIKSNNYYENPSRMDSIGKRVINAFCIFENTAFLNKKFNNDITVLHGIRSISSGIVVALHVFFVNNWIGTINYLDVEKDVFKYHLNSFAHAELVVDTFLMMSGLLLIKGLMSRQHNLLIVILKRYLRFALMLGIVFLYSLHVLRYSGDGPLWPRVVAEEADICRKNWWVTLLMLGNYVDTTNICYPVLWTVPCDFHLSMMGVLIFWLYKKNRRAAFAAFAVLLIAAIIMPGVVTYQQKLPPVPRFDMRSIKDYRKTVFQQNPTYIQSHLRAGPYLVGIAVGYLISTYKLNERKNLIPKAYSIIGFTIALVTALQIMLMGGVFQDRLRPYNVWEAVLFASFNRTLWAIAIACLIACCEFGTVPIVSPLLKAQTFLSLSKLSYGTYLLHTLVFALIVAPSRTPLNHGMFTVTVHTFGVIVVCTILSLLIYLFIEAPMSNLINIVFDNKKNKNGTTAKEHEWKNNNIDDKQKKTS